MNCFFLIHYPIFLTIDFICSLYISRYVRHHIDTNAGVIGFIVPFCLIAGLWYGLWWKLGVQSDDAIAKMMKEGEGGSILRVEPMERYKSRGVKLEGGKDWIHLDVFLRLNGTIYDPFRLCRSTRNHNFPSMDEFVGSWKEMDMYDIRYLEPSEHAGLGEHFGR